MQLWKRNYQKAWSMCRVVVLIMKPNAFSHSHSCHGHQILRSLLSSLNLIILKPCHRVSLKEAGWLLGLCRWLFETKLMVICLDSHLNVSACYLKLLTVSSSSNTVSKSIKALHAHVITAVTLRDTVGPPPPTSPTDTFTLLPEQLITTL